MPDQLEALVARLRELATLDEDSGRRRLPPERVLGEALGMSRGALREQLAVLERLGFIDRTQGRGTFLASPSYDFVRTYFRIARDLGYLTDTEFSESRLLLEEALAEAAARRATPEQVAQLRGDVDRMVASQSAADFDDAHEADVTFHSRLQGIVDNPVLRFLHEGISHVLRDDIAARRQEVAEGVPEPGGRTDSIHYDIVDAIATGDAVGARLAMRRHFGGVVLGMPIT
ncbi:FadR/GntR family transcriptional regulator [Microbacterium sp. CPCC 204701]|uniref:FadR/GntR family transcriptional regulator n=1 Tax=Microbacterium sp. CPCC 204701 TaxID=2493084 RepID=UPI001F0C9330|nr:FCD domain-containing protein [Microbacterium sp. CPCC 204701]